MVNDDYFNHFSESDYTRYTYIKTISLMILLWHYRIMQPQFYTDWWLIVYFKFVWPKKMQIFTYSFNKYNAHYWMHLLEITALFGVFQQNKTLFTEQLVQLWNNKLLVE